MAAKRKPGRPPRMKKAAMCHLSVRLTEAELKAIRKAAAKAGEPATVWARDALLQAARHNPKETA